MRRTLFLCLVLILAIPAGAGAETVSRDDARQAGENWLASRGETALAIDGAARSLFDPERENVLLGYHLPLQPQGFMIISARRELPAVKAFSYDTNFDPTETDGASALLMESMAATEAFLSDWAGSFGEDTETAFRRHREGWNQLLGGSAPRERDLPVGPFIESSWHQSPPYNNDCPPGAGGSTCVVGCVATSAAMILKYWEFPVYGDGSHSYQWGGDDSCGPNEGGGTLLANFTDAYDWDNILHSYGGGSSDAERAAAAELNYEVAVAFEMDFGVCGSGTYVSIGTGIYPNYFRYSEDIEFLHRNGFDADGWWERIKREMDAFPPRPIHYRINSHSIICDGYQDDAGARYYHMNYGWGGSQNLWYALDDVYCPWDGCDYMVEAMLVNIEPEGHFGVSAPVADEVWLHGDPLPMVIWTGATGSQVVLDLYKGTEFVTRLADWSGNDGNETPAGLVDPFWGTGDDYRVKVVGDDMHFGWSGTFGVYGPGSWAEIVDLPLGDSGNGQSVAWADCDGDGRPDIHLAVDGATNHLLGNGLAGWSELGGAPLNISGHSRGAAWADIDNDGDLDLHLARTSGESNLLFRNDGGGFTDISAGPTADTGYSNDAVWGDYDADGLVDLFIVNAYAADRLLRNTGAGVFEDVTAAPLGDSGWGRSANWVDYDGDGLLDIYLVRSSSNKLYRNNGDGSFSDQSIASGCADSGNGHGAAWGDYDGDGHLDLYLSNEGANRLYHNNGDGSFSNVTTAPLDDAGSGRGVLWSDFDADGALDLYLVNDGSANKLFRNLGAGLFADNTHPLLGDGSNGSAAASADFDGDGALDLYLVNSYSADRLLRNETTGGHWLEIDLEGTASNRLGIGARLTAVAGGVSQTRQLGGDAGHMSRNAPTLHFGFGSTTLVDTLRILWPSGTLQELHDLAVDQRISVLETTTAAEELPVAATTLLDARPNPFNPSTSIRFELARAGAVELAIFDLAGRRLRVLLDEERREAGTDQVTWDGRDDRGNTLPSGVYLVQLNTADHREAKKLVLLK
jgi:hypothetical protein